MVACPVWIGTCLEHLWKVRTPLCRHCQLAWGARYSCVSSGTFKTGIFRLSRWSGSEELILPVETRRVWLVSWAKGRPRRGYGCEFEVPLGNKHQRRRNVSALGECWCRNRRGWACQKYLHAGVWKVSKHWGCKGLEEPSGRRSESRVSLI